MVNKPISDIIAAFDIKGQMHTFTLVLMATGRKYKSGRNQRFVQNTIAELKKELNAVNYHLRYRCDGNSRKYYYIEKYASELLWPCQVPKEMITFCEHKSQCQSGIRGRCKVKGR